MIDWAARARHRQHTRLTKKLSDAQYALERAERADPHPRPGIYESRITRAQNRIAYAMAELKRFEEEHPDE